MSVSHSARGGMASGRRRGSVRAARVRRRRRRAFSAGALVVFVLAVALEWPSLHRAYRQLALPLSDASVIREQAAEKHLDPALIAAVIFAETKFRPRTSPTGALGLMQIEPGTAAFLAHRSRATSFTVADLATPEVNVAYGSYYLRMLLDHYGGRELPALAAYNGGEANTDRWVAAAEANGHALGPSDIPFPETRDYVVRVLNAQEAYRHQYAAQLGL